MSRPLSPSLFSGILKHLVLIYKMSPRRQPLFRHTRLGYVADPPPLGRLGKSSLVAMGVECEPVDATQGCSQTAAHFSPYKVPRAVVTPWLPVQLASLHPTRHAASFSSRSDHPYPPGRVPTLYLSYQKYISRQEPLWVTQAKKGAGGYNPADSFQSQSPSSYNWWAKIKPSISPSIVFCCGQALFRYLNKGSREKRN